MKKIKYVLKYIGMSVLLVFYGLFYGLLILIGLLGVCSLCGSIEIVDKFKKKFGNKLEIIRKRED